MSVLVFLFYAAFTMFPRKLMVLVGGAPTPKSFSDVWKGLKK